MKEIMQMNYSKADMDFFEIEGKRLLEIFLVDDNNRSSSKADHDDDDFFAIQVSRPRWPSTVYMSTANYKILLTTQQ